MKKVEFKERMSDMEYQMYVMYCNYMGHRPLPQNYVFELNGDMANQFIESQMEDERSEDYLDCDATESDIY